MKRYSIAATVLTALAGFAIEAGAQTVVPSARGYALANAYIGRARGYEGPFWNPANLGLPGRPPWSVGLAGINAYVNNNSLTFLQIFDLLGNFLDDEEKSKLLAEVREDDPNRMFEASFDVGAGVSGASIGRFAFGVGSGGAGGAQLSADAIELLLFGNDGEAGTGKDFTLEESDARAWSLTAGFVSYAQPFTISALDRHNMNFSVGASIKYGVAHAFARFLDKGSRLTAIPLTSSVDAELLSANDGTAGQFWSFDLGVAMDWDDRLVAGISVHNLLSNISWNEEEFELRLYVLESDLVTTVTTDTMLAFDELSAEDRERIAEFLDKADIPARLRLGAAYEVSPKFSLSADYKELIGGTLRARWDRALSVGGEFTFLSWLPLRLGLATDFDQFAYTTGFGIYLAVLHTDIAVGRWGVAGGDGLVAALSLSIWPKGSW
jgi:hypothetical protein